VTCALVRVTVALLAAAVLFGAAAKAPPVRVDDWDRGAPGPLDLDHVGPHVAEHLRAERTGDVLREVGDDDAFERERHAESLPPRSVPDFPWHQRSKLSH